MPSLFQYDLYRIYGRVRVSVIDRLRFSAEIKYIYYFRQCQYWYGKSRLIWAYYRFRLARNSNKSHIQIPWMTKIGRGFYISHTGRVIINPRAVIGENCNIATGVTIGMENRGKRKGSPIIGNKVWIGTNAVIVGNITIGDDVLIAPNAYVNFEVPSHSIVVGNPSRIIPRNNATDGYINRIVE
jgi:serine O-acetyltransferase